MFRAISYGDQNEIDQIIKVLRPNPVRLRRRENDGDGAPTKARWDTAGGNHVSSLLKGRHLSYTTESYDGSDGGSEKIFLGPTTNCRWSLVADEV